MHVVANVVCAAILLLPSYAFMAPVKYNELAPGTNRSHCTTRYVREHKNRLHEHAADAVTGASGGRTDGTTFEQFCGLALLLQRSRWQQGNQDWRISFVKRNFEKLYANSTRDLTTAEPKTINPVRR
jgi:hypothetical protein